MAKGTFSSSTFKAKTFADGTFAGPGNVPPPVNPVLGGSGGAIFDMQSITVTDQILDFPDWVYQIPVAQTIPLLPIATLFGRINSRVIMGNGGSAIAGGGEQHDETQPVPVTTFADPETIAVRRQTMVGGRTVNGRTVQGKVRK